MTKTLVISLMLSCGLFSQEFPNSWTPQEKIYLGHKYSGEYFHPELGYIYVEQCQTSLEIRGCIGDLILEQQTGDVFKLLGSGSDKLFFFERGEGGAVEKVSFYAEEGGEKVIFRKKIENSPSYLRRFTGIYEIYYVTVEVFLEGSNLIAKFPGFPPYTLVPHSQNEFSVISLKDHLVQFLFDDKGDATEVVLTHPSGTYRAKPQRLG